MLQKSKQSFNIHKNKFKISKRHVGLLCNIIKIKVKLFSEMKNVIYYSHEQNYAK